MAVKTPCVGICSTGIGDSICRGCKRYAHEVVAWNALDDEQKEAVLARLDLLMEQVLKARMVIVNEPLMRSMIDEFPGQIRTYPSPYMQAYELIKCLQDRIDTGFLRDYGIELRHAYWTLPLRLLFKELDDDLYQLSQAHYQRYFGAYQQIT